jgi:hypothetical protein
LLASFDHVRATEAQKHGETLFKDSLPIVSSSKDAP